MIIDGGAQVNVGITLPGNKNATHNIEFSPLFFARTGRVYHWVNKHVFVSTYRGSSGFFWTQTTQGNTDAGLLWVGIYDDLVSPSHSASTAWAWSLRCLVSTNNG